MFRFDPAVLDEHIDQALNNSRRARDSAEPFPDSAAPGFTIGEVFADQIDSSLGPKARLLAALVYRLFVSGHGIVRGPSASPGKPVLFERGRRAHGVDTPYLAVTAGADRVLVPFPALPEELIAGEPLATVGDARTALHAAVWRIVERANLAWPVALALAQQPAEEEGDHRRPRA